MPTQMRLNTRSPQSGSRSSKPADCQSKETASQSWFTDRVNLSVTRLTSPGDPEHRVPSCSCDILSQRGGHNDSPWNRDYRFGTGALLPAVEPFRCSVLSDSLLRISHLPSDCADAVLFRGSLGVHDGHRCARCLACFDLDLERRYRIGAQPFTGIQSN